jgi:aspartate aminotransferase
LGDRCSKILNDAGIRVIPPVGAFYLFLDFTQHTNILAKRGIKDSRTLCTRLLHECGVAILPGVSFERPASELTARLAYVNFDGAKTMAASETIPIDEKLPEDFINNKFEQTITGTEKIIEWVKKSD